MSTLTDEPTKTAPAAGVAGRTNYAEWDKLTKDMVETVEKEEEAEAAESKAKLGLDGKYASSAAEAEEREKAKNVRKVKKTLEKYKKREQMAVTLFQELLGPVKEDDDDDDGGAVVTNLAQEEKTTEADAKIVRITRDRMDAGKRVISLADTSGRSLHDKIVLTQDLSHLESKMKANSMAQPKTFKEDAENKVEENVEEEKHRSVFGIIKAFINNVHNCTVLVKCKIITGTIEMHNCSNVLLRIETEATVATVQCDLSENITIEFRDAPSGKNAPLPGRTTHQLYWGEDRDDRIYHAGVNALTVRVIRDDFIEHEITADYLKDGAEAVGNATAEEMQFITSVVDGKLQTERAVRAGQSTGKNVRAMTERELADEKKRREKAATMAVAMAEDMVKVTDKHGNELVKKTTPTTTEDVAAAKDEDEDIEEFYTMTKEEIQTIVDECEHNKARGNEAFGHGEYGQAILLYSLSLDKADELPDTKESKKKLFPRDLVYSNRSACFLKLGQHEKAEADAKAAMEWNPTNIKANFRRGLALHAMKEYEKALPYLAAAYKQEPTNKQIKQALQFCEVRLEQEMRKRMGKV